MLADRKAFGLIFGYFLSATLIAQPNFEIDTTLLESHAFKLVDFSKDTGVAVTYDNRFFLISPDYTITEVAFPARFSGAVITSVGMAKSGLFFVGTESDSLLVFESGSFRQKGKHFGINSSEINSIQVESGTVKFGTDHGLYQSTSPFKSAAIAYNWEGRRISLTAQNPFTEMFKVERDPYCSNIPNNSFVNLAVTGTYVTGVSTFSEFVGKEIVRDGILLYAGGRFIWNYCDLIYGSNLALRYNDDLCSPRVKTLVEAPVNDMTLFNRERIYNFPDVAFAATDSGAYCVENLYNINEVSATLVSEIGKIRVSSLSIKDGNCDNAIWMATDKGLVKYQSLQEDIKYSRYIPNHYEQDWCKDDYHAISAINHGNFEYQWLRNGEPMPGETSSQLKDFEPGFYQLIYRSCHVHDTVDVTTYIYYDEVNTDISYNGDLNVCDNEHISLYAPYGLEQTYQWYKDGLKIPGATGRSIQLDTTGSYKYETFNCNNVSAFSESVDVNVYPAEAPKLDPDYIKDEYCSGDTLKLLLPQHEVTIRWADYWGTVFSEFDNKSFLILENDAPDLVSFKTPNQCEETLRLPYISVNSRPYIELSADSIELCPNDGKTVYVSTNGQGIIWSDGYIGPNRVLHTAGVYYCHAESYQGCDSYTDSVIVTVASVPEFDLLNDTLIYFGDSLIINGPEGFEEYVWNGRQTADKDFFFKPAKKGVYYISLRIYAAEGTCYGEEIAVINVVERSSPLGFSQETPGQPILYPNPAHDLLNIESPAKFDLISISDLSGRNVTPQTAKTGTTQIDVSQLPSGVYLIYLDGKNFRFIKD